MLKDFYIIYLGYQKRFGSTCVLSNYDFIKKIALYWVEPVNYYPKHNMKLPT